MKNEAVMHLRESLIPSARGVVVEVGIGSGLNLPFYTSSVDRLHGVDPSTELLTMARARAGAAPFPVELRNEPAEAMSLPDTSADTVVVTFSLCSIADPAAAIREMRRVLKPEGVLIFIEHGLSPDAGVRTWQNRLTPLWRRCTGGCHLNRRIDNLILEAGFSIRDLQASYLPGPRVATYVYQGQAVIAKNEERKTNNE